MLLPQVATRVASTKNAPTRDQVSESCAFVQSESEGLSNSAFHRNPAPAEENMSFFLRSHGGSTRLRCEQLLMAPSATLRQASVQWTKNHCRSTPQHEICAHPSTCLPEHLSSPNEYIQLPSQGPFALRPSVFQQPALSVCIPWPKTRDTSRESKGRVDRAFVCSRVLGEVSPDLCEEFCGAFGHHSAGRLSRRQVRGSIPVPWSID